MKKLIIILFALMLFACNSKTIKYTVYAGQHYSTKNVTILDSDVLKYSFTTDSSWVWETPDKNGWSKVTGIAWNSNHENSVRLVYMRSNGIGVLGYYYYLNGISPQQNGLQKGILDTIVIGNTYQGRLGWENGFYFVEMNGKHHSLKVGYPLPDFHIKTLSNLYIGGTYTIEHDWKSKVKIR